MRPSVVVAVILILNGACRAQEPAAKFITVPEVKVRSGASDQFYETSVLRHGDSVQVLSEERGWLAIKPPSGSFSWVSAAAVKRTDGQFGVVESDQPVPVMPGSSLTNKAPNVEQVKLEKGAVVVILGEAFSPGSGTSFLPIQPPPNEKRYIPADAVKPQQFVGTPTVPNPLPPGLNNDLISQADAALQSGNIEAAKRLYAEAAEKCTDYQQKTYCNNRLASLGQGPDGHPGHPNQSQGVAMAPGGHITGQPASSVYQTMTIQRNSTTQPPNWSAWGILRRTAFKSNDGQAMYVLENQKGQALLYVTAQSGLSLTNFIGRTISLYGPIMYRSDDYMRSHYMVASHIALP